MAEEENPLSLLNLVIERGPRSGETFQFFPTDPLVRLGRFVRGNSVPIKDPSISTKHLTIEFKSPHWLITDLASSNGTVLNSSLLPSLSPTVLRDGDFVKIGEVTVIKVGIEVGRSRNGQSGCDVSEGELPRGRMRREKVAEEGTESGFCGELGKKGVGVVTRGRGRSKRKKGEIFSEKVGVAAEVFEKKTRGRRGKEKVPDAEGLGPVKAEPGPQVSTRRTRSARLVENAEKEVVNDAHIGGVKMTEKGKKQNDNKSKLGSLEGNCIEKGNVIDVRSGDGLNSERVVVKNEPRESFCEVENVGSLHSLGEERERGGESVKESGFKSLEATDLAKMTLGDFFDYLEVSLPKQIIEKTELIIAEMHKKAEVYREFVRENKKGKGTCK